jgi:hypothetical protein
MSHIDNELKDIGQYAVLENLIDYDVWDNQKQELEAVDKELLSHLLLALKAIV